MAVGTHTLYEHYEHFIPHFEHHTYIVLHSVDVSQA
jgi:hypothetical protein